MGIVKKLGRPISGAATNMKSLPVGGADGSTQQAEGQIRNAPRPFGNPHLNPMQASGQVSAVTPQQRRQFAGTHASGVKPRHWSAAQAHSDPPAQSTMNRRVGQKPSYRATKPPSDGVPGLKVPKFKSNQDIFSPDVMSKYYGRM